MKALLSALVLSCIVAVALSANCCTPDRWEGIATVYDKTKDFRAIEFISYEFNNQRPRMRVDRYIDEIDKNRTLFMTEYMFGREDEFVEIFTHVKDQCK